MRSVLSVSLSKEISAELEAFARTTGKVDYLVTGDTDLLALRTFGGINIIPPREFECLFPD